MIEDIMRNRRSIRNFKKMEIERETLERLVELAITAPSASNKQPWRFYVVDKAEILESMGQAVQAAVDEIAQNVDESFRDMFRDYGDYFVRFTDAPAVFVVAYTELPVLSQLLTDVPLDGRLLRNIHNMEFNSGLVSASLAVQNLMLYASSLGLGTSCMTGPLTAEDSLKAMLGIPDSWHIAALLPVGYPDESPTPVKRKPVKAVIRWVEENQEQKKSIKMEENLGAKV